MSTSYFFIVNPMAGKGRHLSYVRDIENYCVRKGMSYEIALTKNPLHASALAQKASQDFSFVIAVGGDGTVNEVAQGLTGTNAALGVLPMGSGNDFAHQLGFTSYVKKNLEILLRAKLHRIDLCKINNERLMCNGFGVGFDGEVAAHVREYTKFVSGFPAYFMSVLRTLPTYQFKSAQVILDDTHTLISKILLVAVCNGTTYGGGFKVAPSAKFDDGVLTICLVKKTSKLYALRKLPLFMKGAHVHLPEVETYTAKKVEISVTPASVSQIDGEVLPLQKSFRLDILPQALSVIIA